MRRNLLPFAPEEYRDAQLRNADWPESHSPGRGDSQLLRDPGRNLVLDPKHVGPEDVEGFLPDFLSVARPEKRRRNPRATSLYQLLDAR